MTDIPKIRPASSRHGAIAVSLFLCLGYVITRSILYSWLPADTDHEWCYRDTLSDIPRAFFLFCAWRYGKRLWNSHQLGFHSHKVRECLLLGVLLSAPLLVRPFFFAIGRHSTGWLPVLLASSILAAFLEEILMRSVLLRALFDQYGGKVALWGSSLIFLAFHMSTQPWWTWPDLFSIGVCLAVARIQGVSIWGIVLIHAIYNSLGVLLPPTGEYPPLWYISVFLVHGYIAAMYGMAYKVRFLKPSVNRL